METRNFTTRPTKKKRRTPRFDLLGDHLFHRRNRHAVFHHGNLLGGGSDRATCRTRCPGNSLPRDPADRCIDLACWSILFPVRGRPGKMESRGKVTCDSPVCIAPFLWSPSNEISLSALRTSMGILRKKSVSRMRIRRHHDLSRRGYSRMRNLRVGTEIHKPRNDRDLHGMRSAMATNIRTASAGIDPKPDEFIPVRQGVLGLAWA